MSSTPQPLFSTLRFIESTGQPCETKKRIASKACESCRRRKKRCFHAPENQTDISGDAENNEDEDQSRGRLANESQSPAGLNGGSQRPAGLGRPYQASIPERDPRPRSTGSAAAPTHSRFIGDLNPAVELLSATTPTGQPKNSVGVWHNEAAEHSNTDGGASMFSPMSPFHGCPESMQEHLRSLVKFQCLEVLPSRQKFEILEAFYFENVHPILPCVDQTLYWQSPVNNPTKILQEQIVCLVTCPNPSLRALLKLPGSEGTLLPADFARKIVNGMRLSIEMALVQDKTVVIQALTAMSLIAYGRESLELTPQFFIRAVQHGYTIGLHQPGDVQRNEKTAGLFCSVWSMDRLHAAMQGRPVIMHEADMAKSPKVESASQHAGFRVLVDIAILLDEVISLYRPEASSVEIPDDKFPSFEEILDECGATHLSAHLIATLELFYHAVAILSCRYSSGPHRDSSKARNSRQASSAMQILSIMEDSTVVDKVVALPWVPYAVSLSLSTAYHDFRHCKALTHRNRAKTRLMQAYKYLVPFGQVFWSAAFMAEMAAKILQEKPAGESTGVQSQEASRRPSALQNGTQTLPENTLFDSAAVFDPGLSLFDMGVNWKFDDLDGILEGNLDPSIPWYHQDMQNFFSMDLP